MKQNFDKLVKEKVDRYTEPYDPSSWDDMNRRLDLQSQNKRGWFIPSAALLIAGLGIAYFLYQSNKTNVLGKELAIEKTSEQASIISSNTNTNTNQNTTTLQNNESINTTTNEANHVSIDHSNQTESSKVAAAAIAKSVDPVSTSEISNISEIQKNNISEKKNITQLKSENKVLNENKKIGNRSLNDRNENNHPQAQEIKKIQQSNKPQIKKKAAIHVVANAGQNNSTINSSNNSFSTGAITSPIATSSPAEIKNTYGATEKEIIVDGNKKFEVIGELPVQEKMKLSADSFLMASSVKRSEDTAIPIPKMILKSKIPILFYAGIGTSFSVIDQGRNNYDNTAPQFDATILGGIGLWNKNKFPIIEILSGIGLNFSNYKADTKMGPPVKINDTTKLLSFATSYRSIAIPIVVKYNFFQKNNLAFYAKINAGVNFIIQQSFKDQYRIDPNQNNNSGMQSTSIDNPAYGLEDFRKQRHDERQAKSDFFNENQSYFTFGAGVGMVWKYLFVETNYVVEPNIMNHGTKHNFGIQTGIRLRLNK